MRNRILVLLALTVGGLIVWALLTSGPRIPEAGVLVVEIGGTLEEAPPVDALDRVMARGLALPTLLLQLDKAAADPRIRGVLLHVRPLQLGYARVQELRSAIKRVRAAGKVVVALLDTSTFNATRETYLAAAAEHVYVVPAHLGPFVGVSGHYLTLGGLFERIGVRMEYERIGKWKSAPESYAARELSVPAREQATRIVDGVFGQLVNDVAGDRGMPAATLRGLIDRGLGTGPEFVDVELAHGIAGREEVLERVGLGELEEVELATYAGVDPRDLDLRTGDAIAIVFGDGAIVPGRGGRTGGFAADDIAEALDQAREADDVAAVVFRVNSGGGSALASERIWRAVRALREEKPVVVSMADAAASGGYYVASAANAVLAQPATVTGSIGVFFVRPVLGGLYEKLDIGSELIVRGRFAELPSGRDPLGPAARQRARHFVRSMYDDFLGRVSTGRKLPRERIDELGQGQVWLGETALSHGLIDDLGGLHEAVLRARDLAGLPADVDPARVILPGPRGLGEQLRDLLQGAWKGALYAALWPDELRLPELLRTLGAWLPSGELAYLPPFWIDLE